MRLSAWCASRRQHLFSTGQGSRPQWRPSTSLSLTTPRTTGQLRDVVYTQRSKVRTLSQVCASGFLCGCISARCRQRCAGAVEDLEARRGETAAWIRQRPPHVQKASSSENGQATAQVTVLNACWLEGREHLRGAAGGIRIAGPDSPGAWVETASGRSL